MRTFFAPWTWTSIGIARVGTFRAALGSCTCFIVLPFTPEEITWSTQGIGRGEKARRGEVGKRRGGRNPALPALPIDRAAWTSELYDMFGRKANARLEIGFTNEARRALEDASRTQVLHERAEEGGVVVPGPGRDQ